MILVRVMRLLTAAGYAGETSDETYVSSSLTKAMNTPVMEASIKHRSVEAWDLLHLFAPFFSSTSAPNVTDVE